MFCKKCGKNIKDTTSFCPYCGCQIKKNKESKNINNETSVLVPSVLTEKEKEKIQKRWLIKNPMEENGRGWLWVIGVFIILILATSLTFIFVRKQKQTDDIETYSIIGEWSSEDLSDLGSIMSKAAGDNGWIIDGIIGDALGEVTVTFLESGSIILSCYDLSMSIGTFTYEIIGDNKMMLIYEVTAWNNPVRISYSTNYKVSEHRMTLDFFGEKITLNRED